MSEIKSNVSELKNEDASIMSKKKQWFFISLFILIALLSVGSVVLQMEDFTVSEFVGYINAADVKWFAVAFVSMLCYVFFEGFALIVLCRAMGYKSKIRHGYAYSAADIYFSALTPSSTGGQPASAYFMIKDGINGMLTTAILVTNLCMYTLSIIVIGTFCFIMHWDYFLLYSLTSRILIIVGFFVEVALLVFFYMVLKKEKLLHSMCNSVLRFLCKLKILKNYEGKREKLADSMEKYHQHSKVITGHPKALALCFVFNFIQRVAQILISTFVYIATSGKSFMEALDIFFWQGYSVLGANLVPIPGAMGISDQLMLEGFENVIPQKEAGQLVLLSRSFAFYSCVILCGITFFVCYYIVKKREKRKC